MIRQALALTPLVMLLACADRTQSTTDTTGSSTQGASTQAQAATTGTGATTGAVGAESTNGLLDPNTATNEQLVAAGVDASAIAALMAARPFADMTAVDRALAGKASADQRKALYAKVWKPLDLNSAKGEEILLIPGVGARMRREFEEYRPYTSMEQFRREMGKYVSKEEVARLERYVMIR